MHLFAFIRADEFFHNKADLPGINDTWDLRDYNKSQQGLEVMQSKKGTIDSR